MGVGSRGGPGNLGPGGEWDLLCGNLVAYSEPRDHAAIAVIPHFHPGIAGNGECNHQHSYRRRFVQVLDCIARRLRCGVYYRLSLSFRDSIAGGMKRAFPILAVLTALLLGYSFYEAMFVAPTDQMQGDVYRIIYYHVPSAWSAFAFFLTNFIASVVYLLRRNLKADAVAVAAAEI